MKRRPLLIALLILLCGMSSGAQQPASEPVDGFVWPIAGKAGKVVLGFGMVPNPRSGNLYFNEGYFIAAPAGSNVVAMHDGVIVMPIRYTWEAADKPVSVIFDDTPGPDQLAQHGLKLDDLYGAVVLDCNGLRLFYAGLSLAPGLQKGKSVKAGDVLGQVTGIKSFYDEPVIRVVGSRGKSVDIGPYLFGGGYVAKPLPAPTKNPDPARLYTPQELLADLDFVWSALEEAHPALYDYTSREEFGRLLAESRKALEQPATAARFNVVLRRLLARIGCGHTETGIPAVGRKATVFPLDVRVIGGRLYVVGGTVPSGPAPLRSEILSINDEPAASVLDSLRGLVPSDGHNVTGKDVALSSPRLFRTLFQALYGEVPAFRVALKMPDGKQEVASLPAVSQEEAAKWPSAATTTASAPAGPTQAIRYLAGNLAYWRIASFALFDRDSINRIFEELETRHVGGLVIDVRGNRGGEMGELEYVYSLLAQREFRLRLSSQATALTYSFLDRTANLVAGAKVNADLEPVAGKAGLHTFAKRSQPATEHRYTGKVYVLMDGGTFSAAAVFCGLMHREKRGVLVGEETGGGYYQLTAEKFAQVVLHSVPSIVVIPLRKIVTTDVRDAGIPFGRGVMPDHPVGRTSDDYLVPGTDTMLAYVVKLAGGTRN